MLSLRRSPRPKTFVSIPGLSFTLPAGGANPAPQIVTVTSSSSALQFTPSTSTSSGGKWLSVAPYGLGCCTTPYAVEVSVSAAGLAAGTYQGQLDFTDYSNAGNKLTVPVTLTVAQLNVGFFGGLPGALSYSFTANGTPTPQAIQIEDGGSAKLKWTVAPTTTDPSNWLTVSSSSGTAPSTVTVGIDANLLPGGGAMALISGSYSSRRRETQPPYR